MNQEVVGKSVLDAAFKVHTKLTNGAEGKPFF
jgi:hypothetical protein